MARDTITVKFDMEAATKVAKMQLREQNVINHRLAEKIGRMKDGKTRMLTKFMLVNDLVEQIMEAMTPVHDELPISLVGAIHELNDYLHPEVTPEQLARRRERVETRRAARLAKDDGKHTNDEQRNRRRSDNTRYDGLA